MGFHNKKDLELYFLFSVNINNKYIYYLSNPFSARRVILLRYKNNNDFFKTDKIKWSNGKIVNNDTINELLYIIDKKINNYENVKRIYFMDENMKDEKGYVRFLNNKKCVFLHLPLNKYNNIEIMDIHIKIKLFIKRYLEKELKENKIIIKNNNLYKLQYYLNMKFIYIFNFC